MSDVRGMVDPVSERPDTAESDAGMCGASHQAIDNGAPCKYLAGHLDAGIPHTTANGFWWSDTTDATPAEHRRFGAGCTGCDWTSADFTLSLVEDHRRHVESLTSVTTPGAAS